MFRSIFSYTRTSSLQCKIFNHLEKVMYKLICFANYEVKNNEVLKRLWLLSHYRKISNTNILQLIYCMITYPFYDFLNQRSIRVLVQKNACGSPQALQINLKYYSTIQVYFSLCYRCLCKVKSLISSKLWSLLKVMIPNLYNKFQTFLLYWLNSVIKIVSFN